MGKGQTYLPSLYIEVRSTCKSMSKRRVHNSVVMRSGTIEHITFVNWLDRSIIASNTIYIYRYMYVIQNAINFLYLVTFALLSDRAILGVACILLSVVKLGTVVAASEVSG